MLYKTILNLVRLRLIQLILKRFISAQNAKGRNVKTISVFAYLLEIGLTFLFDLKTNKYKKTHKKGFSLSEKK